MTSRAASSHDPGGALSFLGEVLARLDERSHVMPASLELTRHPDGDGFDAQIIADPLRTPVSAAAATSEEAVSSLAAAATSIDWRKVAR